MSKKTFKKIFTNDFSMQKIQDNVQGELNRLNASPFQDGIFVKSVSLTTSDTKVEHKLSRVPMGYVVTNKNAAQTVYTSTSVNNKPELFLILKASGSVTVDLYIY
jgi:hypothetical protein